MRVRRTPTLLASSALVAGLLTAGSAPAAGQVSAQNHEQSLGNISTIAKHSLRTGVTDEDFYFVMADRFANGDTANDTGGLGDDPLVSGFDPTHRGFYHGGDLKGLLSKLDYIQGMGIESLWLTPSFKNKAVQLEDGPSAGYHGYWITDFTRIDPHLGTNTDLANLVDAAHARGMKVYFDIITNHTADVIGYEEGARTAYVPKDVDPYRTASGEPFDDRDYAGSETFPPLHPDVSFPYTPVLEPGEETLKVPNWLNDVTLYHNRGNTTFVGEDSEYGDFFGLDDLFTEHPTVVGGMIDIYRTWIGDFGIDGFRIDTMKHVNDEFWQEFIPGILDYARANGKPDFFAFGEVALDGYGEEQKAFLSHWTVHNDVQAVLDFAFKDAARDFASRSVATEQLAEFFVNDDWFTDEDSNVYSLPTFLGNHDFGRIGHFIATDNPDASAAELLKRDRLAHELMYFSRGNPVIYYGDEQGFTGAGGDQLARQSMFASQVEDYLDDDLLGTDRTHAQDNFVRNHPLYRHIRKLSDVTERYPALRDGAHQVRYADDAAGVLAFSRTDPVAQRELVVALNNSESPKTVRIPTYGSRTFSIVYGSGRQTVRTARNGTLQVTVPALSTIIYRSNGKIPRSKVAPAITLRTPVQSDVDGGRMHVRADVAGRSFYEVTFQAKVGDGPWTTIGTDDTAPYQVFHDVSDEATGTALRYRAVVLDNARHTRLSGARSATVPAPYVTITAPEDGGEVSVLDPVTVEVAVDPLRVGQSVRVERSVSGGAWEEVGTDSSLPAFRVSDDVGDLALDTEVRYRAVLLEEGFADVTSDVTTVTVAPPRPARDVVTLVGDLQSEVGCPGDWDPACTQSRLAFDTTDGQWHGEFDLPEGSFQWKIAIDNSWDENYGAGGAAGGDNIALTVPAGGATYRFTWNQTTRVPSVEQVS